MKEMVVTHSKAHLIGSTIYSLLGMQRVEGPSQQGLIERVSLTANDTRLVCCRKVRALLRPLNWHQTTNGSLSQAELEWTTSGGAHLSEYAMRGTTPMGRTL